MRKSKVVVGMILLIAMLAVIMVNMAAQAKCNSKLHKYSKFSETRFCTDPEGVYGCLNAKGDTITAGGCLDPVALRDYSCRQFNYTYHDVYELVSCVFYVNAYICTYNVTSVTTTTADKDPCSE